LVLASVPRPRSLPAHRAYPLPQSGYLGDRCGATTKPSASLLPFPPPDNAPPLASPPEERAAQHLHLLPPESVAPARAQVLQANDGRTEEHGINHVEVAAVALEHLRNRRPVIGRG